MASFHVILLQEADSHTEEISKIAAERATESPSHQEALQSKGKPQAPDPKKLFLVFYTSW